MMFTDGLAEVMRICQLLQPSPVKIIPLRLYGEGSSFIVAHPISCHTLLPLS